VIYCAVAVPTDDAPELLLAEALALAQSSACDGAVPMLEDLVARFPDSPEAPEALYAWAECLERGDDPDEAIRRYRELLDAYPDAGRARDARFRRGVLQLVQGAYRPALADFRSLRGTTPTERAILDVQRGACHRGLGHPRRATRLLVNALATLQDAEEPWYLAQAHVALGNVLAGAMAGISMEVQGERRQRDRLQQRLALFDRAEGHFRAAADSGVPLWGCAAGYELATLHLRQRDALRATPPPRWVDEGQAQVYRDSLFDRTASYTTAAADLYRQTLTFAATHGVENRWTEAAQDALDALGPTSD